MLVLDFAHGLAGPFASTLLADFGATVVKVERPSGDFEREIDPADGIWWKSLSRGKRSIAIDLANPASRRVVQELVAKADAFVESFRPGALERLGYGPEVLLQWNPQIVVLRTSGYGQTGPYRDRPGFGKVAEAFAGLLHMTGFPDGPPVYTGFAVADMCSGLMGAFGILLAWIARYRGVASGQVIDLALYETVLRLMDYVVPLATGSTLDLVRNGNRQPMSFAPSGIVRARDGEWVVYSAASSEVLHRLLQVVAGEQYASETRFRDLASSRLHLDEIEAVIATWCSTRTADQAVDQLTTGGAVAGLVNTPSDIIADVHVRERGNIASLPGERAKFMNVVPKLSATPGRIRFSGPAEIGMDAVAILRDVLGYTDGQIDAILKSGAIIAPRIDKKKRGSS
jgi:crotonobetainyl-CoA:carnitine CoA-transferase CaiB-like acyl-CoA transferase